VYTPGSRFIPSAKYTYVTKLDLEPSAKRIRITDVATVAESDTDDETDEVESSVTFQDECVGCDDNTAEDVDEEDEAAEMPEDELFRDICRARGIPKIGKLGNNDDAYTPSIYLGE
jgi:hypothetical protein